MLLFRRQPTNKHHETKSVRASLRRSASGRNFHQPWIFKISDSLFRNEGERIQLLMWRWSLLRFISEVRRNFCRKVKSSSPWTGMARILLLVLNWLWCMLPLTWHYFILITSEIFSLLKSSHVLDAEIWSRIWDTVFGTNGKKMGWTTRVWNSLNKSLC